MPKKLGKKLLHFLVVGLLILTLSMLIECIIFQFPALRYKEKPISFKCDGTNSAVTTEMLDDLVELSQDEVKSIEVERDNNKLLAEYRGEKYEEPVDETLVEKNGKMYRKVQKTIVKINLGKPYYIHKLDVRAEINNTAGYSAIFYRDGKVINSSVYCSLEPKIGAGIANISEYTDRFEMEILSQDEIDLASVVITASNDFNPNRMRLFFFTIFFLIIAFMWYGAPLIKEKPEWVFAVLCFALGSLLICGIGTNQVSYDEYVHSKEAYKLSFGSTIESTESAIQMNGNLLPYFNNPEERALIEAYEDVNNDFSWADIGHQSLFVRAETRVYYPMAFGFKLGRVLHLGFANTVQLAKYGNLLFYILVVFFAIKFAKKYKGLIAIIGLLPNCVFLASSLTYDAVVNSFLLLGMVLVTNEILEPERKLTWQNTLLMLVSFGIGCQSKPIYVVMLLLYLFYGKRKFENRLQEWVFKGAVLIMACLMVYNIFRPTPAAGSDYYLVGNFSYAGDKRNLGTSVIGQIRYIFENPITYTLLLLRSMFRMTTGYLIGRENFFQYGYLGTASTIMTYIVLILAFYYMFFSAKGERRKSIGVKFIILNLLMIFGMSAIIWTSMYTSYTTVGAKSISGVQGRYFIPLFLSVFICLFNDKFQSRLGETGRNRIIFCVLCGVNLFMIYTLVIMKMNI